MAIHDELAQKAIEMGKHSSEFSSTAQKSANATLFFLIFAVVVWYFFDWLWSLIPLALGVYSAFQSISATMIATRLESQEAESGGSENDFISIVQAYGKTLETEAPTPGTVADVRKLPYTKQQIKEAIVTALRSTEDSQMREHLRVAYLELSNWQEGVGNTNQGLDLSALYINQDTESLVDAVLEQSSGSEDWTTRAQKERETLKQELQGVGLW